MSSNQSVHPHLVITNQSEYIDLAKKLQRSGYRGEINHGGISYSIYEIYAALQEWHEKNATQEKFAEKVAEAGKEVLEKIQEARQLVLEAKQEERLIKEGHVKTLKQRSSDSLATFQDQQKAQIKAIETQNALAEATSQSAINILNVQDVAAQQHLKGIAKNILANNPSISPESLTQQLINIAHQTSFGIVPPSQPILQTKASQIRDSIDPEIVEANHQAIKAALSGNVGRFSGPISIPEDQFVKQFTDHLAAEYVDFEDTTHTLSKRAARQIVSAIKTTAASGNPENTNNQELVRGIKQVLYQQGNKASAKAVDKLPIELLRLKTNQEYQIVVNQLKPEYAPTRGINQSNLNTITKISQQTHQPPSVVAKNLITTHYQNHPPSPNYQPSFFRRIWSQFFGKKVEIVEYDFQGLAQSTPEYQQILTSNYSFRDFIRQPSSIFKLFNSSGGGVNFSNLGKLNSLGNSLTKLKKLFGFGRGASGLVKGVQAGKAVSSVLGAMSLASIPAWIIPASLIVIAVFLFLYFNRFQLDTVAEVRSNYGAGGGLIEEQSKYASLKKEASITKLEDPTGSITYTYTITPLLGPITITSFNDTTTIFQESGERTLTLDTPPEEPPAELSTTLTSNQFSLKLDSSMDDAMISNTVEITFINPLGQTETISSAAVTIIGNPPFCPPTLAPIDGASKSGWPYVCAESTCLNPPNGHCGVDLSGSLPIKSPFNCQAVVSRVQTSGSESFGHYVVLNSGPYYAFFAHMDGGSITVSEGEFVAPGQVLGMMDNTGNSSGNHLHYEVRSSELGSISVGSNCQPPVSINPCEIPGSEIAGLCN